MRAFFHLAAVSPTRQQTFRCLVAAHLTILAAAIGSMILSDTWKAPMVLGQALLVAGIVEGAMLIGWRLTQLPKSQALEFLLVSPLHPPRLFLAEALVGITRLASVTLAGLPALILLAADGYLDWVDIAPLLLMPFTWGCIT